MDRVGHGGIVDEANNSLSTSLNDEGRSGRYAVIANQVGGGLVGVDLLLESIDVHLVVVNRAASHRVGDGAVSRVSADLVETGKGMCNSQGRRLDRRNRQGILVEPGVGQTLPVLCHGGGQAQDGEGHRAEDR